MDALLLLVATALLVTVMAGLVVMDIDAVVFDESLDAGAAPVFTATIVVELRVVALWDAVDVIVVTFVSFWEDVVETVKLVVPVRAVEEIGCFVLSKLGLVVVDDELELVGLSSEVLLFKKLVGETLVNITTD